MARRRFSIFSLAFLDIMSCGFGAVVLIYLIINHSTEQEAKIVNTDLLSEIRMLDYQILEGEKELFELLEVVDDTSQKVEDSSKRLASTEAEVEKRRKGTDALDAASVAQEAALERLKSDVESRQEEVERLRAEKEAYEGSRIRKIEGQGDRQYLTGMRVGGRHVLIVLDTSASMLDDTIINVLRRRAMDDDRKLKSSKWQRAVRTVEWLAAQLPLDSNFQIYGFDTEPRSLVPDADLGWLPLGDGRNLDAALRALRKTIPQNGSSLENLVVRIRELSPLPDNVYLIVDSLPTQGASSPRKATVTGAERLDHFRAAAAKLPRQIPINVILFPMEGDPLASAAYWNLALVSRGSFIAPSRDWP